MPLKLKWWCMRLTLLFSVWIRKVYRRPPRWRKGLAKYRGRKWTWKTKCRGFWHGTWATVPPFFEGIHWSVLPRKYLDVPLNRYKSSKPYWCDTVVALQEETSKWSNRESSTFARATVCNVFFVAKLFYVLQVLHCGRLHIKKISPNIFSLYLEIGVGTDTARQLVSLSSCGRPRADSSVCTQIIARFLFLRDVQHPFLKGLAQRKLANHLLFFIVSTDCSVSQQVFGFGRR